VRALLFCFLWVTAVGLVPLAADDNVVQEFSGSGTTTTGLFKVKDKWEVRWNARQVVSVAVMSSDGTIVAGAAGVLRGSLFVPLGGQYYLKVSDGTNPPPPPAPSPSPSSSTTSDTNSASAVSGTNTPPAGTTTNAAPASSTTSASTAVTTTNSAPATSSTGASTDTNTPPAPGDSTPASAPEIAWHLQIIQLGDSVAADQELSVYTPYFMVPDSAITPAPPPAPPPVLTNEQASTVVTIKGDRAQGTGFFMRTADGTFVVTHLHLLADNPNVSLLTRTGAAITVLGLKGATDRDLAMFSIKDDHYTYLPLFTDAAVKADTGDQLIIPDVSQQSTDVLLGIAGRIIGMAPDRIDFDNQINAACAGSPVIHAKSGKVMALVTPVKRVDVSDNLARAWPGNPAPGSSRIIPYYGLPLYGVLGWETYDTAHFLVETAFLQQFHTDTRCLDSYLNGRRLNRGQSDTSGPPDNRYFLNNTKIQEANDSYKQFAKGGDQNQQLDAATELLSDLQGVADSNLTTLNSGNFLYTYDQVWAQKELAYRKALKKQLDDLSNNIPKLEDIARMR
jgi:hypothetical protein